MSQFEAALCLMLELIKHRTILNHQAGDKFQRDIALQFFIVCQPDNPHSASAQNPSERVTAEESLSADKLSLRHVRRAPFESRIRAFFRRYCTHTLLLSAFVPSLASARAT